MATVLLTDSPLSESRARRQRKSQLRQHVARKRWAGVRDAQRKVLCTKNGANRGRKGGRYVDAASRGSRFLASGALTEPEQAIVNRQLLEAHVALDATGLATQACTGVAQARQARGARSWSS